MTTVCVHGMGFIGLPTAAILAVNGHRTTGYDPDEAVREEIVDRSFHNESGLGTIVRESIDRGQLDLSAEPRPADYHLVCVPTPLTAEKSSDLSYVKESADTIGELVREGDTVIIESTVPPKTTDDVVKPILETSGYLVDEEIHLVYSPETVLPGQIVHELRENDRIVGGYSDESIERAIDLYETFNHGKKLTTDPTTAEFVKLIQNSYRDVNIGFANEIAVLADQVDISSRKAIALANSHPRVDILDPGPGVGGHCLPVDPWFLIEDQDDERVVKSARDINDWMPTYVAEIVTDHLTSVSDPLVAVLGIAYKGDVDDTRKSPGLSIADEIRKTSSVDTGDSIDIRFNDPTVTSEECELVDLETAFRGADAAVIATDHSDYEILEPSQVQDWMRTPTIVDTRDMIDGETWRSHGFTFESI